MNEPDIMLARIHQRARGDFHDMAQPYIAQIAKIEVLFGCPFMVVKDGITIEHGNRLPEDAKKWIAQLYEIIEYCRKSAFQEFNEYSSRFGAGITPPSSTHTKNDTIN